MFFDERNTDSRARPPPLRRNWKRRRVRRRSRSSWIALMLLLLAFLAPDRLVAVADALALVRLGRAPGADLARDLPDQALVHALHPHRGRALARDLDPVGDRI